MYQRIVVSTQAPVGEPGPLPSELIGLSPATLADLGAGLDPAAAQQLGYTDTGFVWVEPEPVPPPLPAEVPMYKVKKFLVLYKAQTDVDLDAAITTYLEALPEPNRSLALIDWTRSPNLVVNSPLALGAKAALNLTDEQYETLVRSADSLP